MILLAWLARLLSFLAYLVLKSAPDSLASAIVAAGSFINRTVQRRSGGGICTLHAIRQIGTLTSALNYAWMAKNVRRSRVVMPGVEGEWFELFGSPADFSRTIVYMPGGGFIAHDGCEFSFVRMLLTRMSGEKKPRILVLRYALPGSQQRGTLRELTTAVGRWCDGQRVVVAGDSAGGYLAVQMLLSALGADRPEAAARPLAALAVCPLLDLTFSSDSYARNADVDSLDMAFVRAGCSTFLDGDVGADARRAASPVFAPPKVLRALRPGCILVIGGARDLFADDGPLLQRIAGAAGAPSGAVDVHACDDGAWGVHCGVLLPTAEAHSRAVAEAHDAMVSFVERNLAP